MGVIEESHDAALGLTYVVVHTPREGARSIDLSEEAAGTAAAAFGRQHQPNDYGHGKNERKGGKTGVKGDDGNVEPPSFVVFETVRLVLTLSEGAQEGEGSGAGGSSSAVEHMSGYLWPAALASAALVRTPGWRRALAGRRVLELGAGLGLTGLALALKPPPPLIEDAALAIDDSVVDPVESVTLTDHDAVAVARLERQARSANAAASAASAASAAADEAAEAAEAAEASAEAEADTVRALALDWRALSPGGDGADPACAVDAPWVGARKSSPSRSPRMGGGGGGGEDRGEGDAPVAAAAEATAGVGAAAAAAHDAEGDERDGASRQGGQEEEEGARFGAVLGSDVCFYYPLLHPLLDTAARCLAPNDGLLLVVGQANRETQWDFWKAVKSGAYNPRADRRMDPWQGRTEMLLLDLDTFFRLPPRGGGGGACGEGSAGRGKARRFAGEADRSAAKKPGYRKTTFPVGVVVHARPGTPEALVQGLLAGEQVATEQDMEDQLYSF